MPGTPRKDNARGWFLSKLNGPEFPNENPRAIVGRRQFNTSVLLKPAKPSNTSNPAVNNNNNYDSYQQRQELRQDSLPTRGHTRYYPPPPLPVRLSSIQSSAPIIPVIQRTGRQQPLPFDYVAYWKGEPTRGGKSTCRIAHDSTLPLVLGPNPLTYNKVRSWSRNASTPPLPTTAPEKIVLVTADFDRYVKVDISIAKTAIHIRELILNKLNIFDEFPPYSIYRTEIGSFAIGEALSNESISSLCRDQADSKGTLHFFVSVASTPAHEALSSNQPVEQHTIPPILPLVLDPNPLTYNKVRSWSRDASTPPLPTTAPEKIVLVTADSDRYVKVDISIAKTAIHIRELILNKLNIFDEFPPYSIYRTEIGSFAIGEALSNESISSLCRDQADSKGTLHFFVSVASAPTHEALSSNQPVEQHTILPSMVSVNPLSYNKPRSRCENKDGYDADLDNPGRYNKSGPRIAPQQSGATLSSSAPASQLRSPHRHPSVIHPPGQSTLLLSSAWEPRSRSRNGSLSFRIVNKDGDNPGRDNKSGTRIAPQQSGVTLSSSAPASQSRSPHRRPSVIHPPGQSTLLLSSAWEHMREEKDVPPVLPAGPPLSPMQTSDIVVGRLSVSVSGTPKSSSLAQSDQKSARGVGDDTDDESDDDTWIIPPQRRPQSISDEDSWAHRPPPENIYDQLEKFFPTHDTSPDVPPTTETVAALPPPVAANDENSGGPVYNPDTSSPAVNYQSDHGYQFQDSPAIPLATNLPVEQLNESGSPSMNWGAGRPQKQMSDRLASTAQASQTIPNPKKVRTPETPDCMSNRLQSRGPGRHAQGTSEFERPPNSVITAEGSPQAEGVQATGPGQSVGFFSTANSVTIFGGSYQQNVYPITRPHRNSQETRLQQPALIEVSNELLGIGSCGTHVYRGSFQGRDVAVKKLLRDFITLAEREVSILQQSDNHPNVIRYYFQEARENFLFIAIELCPASLADIIEKPDRDQWRDIIINFDPKKALEEITSGLDHLHNLKIIHRDVKPQNILVSTSRNGKGRHRMLISDFGLCKKLDDDQTSFFPTTHGASAAGTRGWQAPEILRTKLKKGFIGANLAKDTVERKLTKSIDIFPLGCMFYYTLTKGRHPYGGEFEREVNILRDIKDLRGIVIFGEDGFRAKDLIMKMLNPEPNQRPDTTICLDHPYFI